MQSNILKSERNKENNWTKDAHAFPFRLYRPDDRPWAVLSKSKSPAEGQPGVH